MSLLKGSATYLRFLVEGEYPVSKAGVLESHISVRRFVPLHQEGEDLESAGWVALDDPYEDERPILNDQFLYGETLVLGFREDRMRYPKPLLKSQINRRIQAHESEHETKASYSTKKNIESAVVAEYRRRILPQSKVTEFTWNIPQKQIRFFTRSKTVADRFVSLFEQTFSLKLYLQSFASSALQAELSLMEKNILESLEAKTVFNTSNHF